MLEPNPFVSENNLLRSFWRAAIYAVSVFVGLGAGVALVYLFLGAILPKAQIEPFLQGLGGFAVQGTLAFSVTFFFGWLCGKLLERLPFKALGCNLHRGWGRDFWFGTLAGLLTLLLATAIGAAGGAQARFNLAAGAGSVGKTVIFSALAFIWFAAAEEVMFRGYALQTMTRAGYAWVGILLTSVAFALAHMNNPNNVSPLFTFTNTALAGVWLAIAYWKTRSLWFPLGLHWSWNWTMGSLIGLPVSGITEIAPTPLLQTTLHGPKWLTGGTYGIEGGIACTLAIVLSTLFIWRTRIVKASTEMLSFDEDRRVAEEAVLPPPPPKFS